MAHIDPMSADGVPPKRNGGRRKAFYILLSLLLIPGGIYTVVGHTTSTTTADTISQVKDVSTTASPAGEVVDDQTAQDTLVPTEQPPVITTYVVKSGDTLSGIAEKFNISVNTIRWANDLTTKTSKITIGDELVILPVTGVEHTVKKGETLSGIAAKYDANQEDILKFNDIEANAIKVGTELIIPGAEPITTKAPTKKPAPTTPKAQPVVTVQKPKDSTPSKVVEEKKTESKKDETASETTVRFVHPMPKGVLTQRIHDGNAVDFGGPVGTPVYAAAAGTVLIAKGSGYNGGYGNYIVINHADGSQTLYAHLSKVSVAVGDTVAQGEGIGLSGNSGRSTGPHLHYKESNTGKKNTFVNLPLH